MRKLALMVLLVLMGCSGAPAQKIEKVEELPPPDLSTRPFGVASEFLSSLQSHKYAAAQRLLSQRLASEVTTADLESRMRGFQSGHPELLEQLQVSREQLLDRRGVVEIRPASADLASKPTWKLWFQKQSGKWRIYAIEGEPFPAVDYRR